MKDTPTSFDVFLLIVYGYCIRSAGSGRLDDFQGQGVTAKAWVFLSVYRAFLQIPCKLSAGCMYIRNNHDKLPTHGIPYPGRSGEMNERRQVREATEFDIMSHRAEVYLSATKEN